MFTFTQFFLCVIIWLQCENVSLNKCTACQTCTLAMLRIKTQAWPKWFDVSSLSIHRKCWHSSYCRSCPAASSLMSSSFVASISVLFRRSTNRDISWLSFKLFAVEFDLNSEGRRFRWIMACREVRRSHSNSQVWGENCHRISVWLDNATSTWSPTSDNKQMPDVISSCLFQHEAIITFKAEFWFQFACDEIWSVGVVDCLHMTSHYCLSSKCRWSARSDFLHRNHQLKFCIVYHSLNRWNKKTFLLSSRRIEQIFHVKHFSSIEVHYKDTT